MKKHVIVIALLALLVGQMAMAQEKLMPARAYKLIMEEARERFEKSNGEDFNVVKKQVCLEYLDKVERQDLSKNELSSLARILAGAGKTMQALELCKGVIMAGGQEASGASRLIFQAMEKDEKISAMQMQALFQEVKAVWSKDPRGRAALSRLESFLFSKMAQEGRAQDVLDIINERMTHVSADSDQSEWDTVRNYLHVYDALGKQEKGEKVTLHYAEKLRTIADKREMDQIENASKEYIQKTKHLRIHAKIFETNVIARHIVGSPAPDFEFTNYFNTEPFKFKELKGRVIVLDFWATWCGPCISTMPKMKKFYEEYKPKGVAVIGITSFQGMVANHGEKPAANLSKDQELALMPKFFKHNNVTWPIAFSTRDCADTKYGINGIPTVIIIDKKGIVRLSSHPDLEEEIRAMVDKLLAE